MQTFLVLGVVISAAILNCPDTNELSVETALNLVVS